MKGVFYVLIVAALLWWLWLLFVEVCERLADRMSTPPNGQSDFGDELADEDVSNDNDDKGV
jgi:hypothetical protein